MTSKFAEMFNEDIIESDTSVKQKAPKMTTVKISEESRDALNLIKTATRARTIDEVVAKLCDEFFDASDFEYRELLRGDR